MTSLTQLLYQVECGDTGSEDLLLDVVYEELRRIAVNRMQGEHPGQTLQPTALVHEAWMRILATRHGGAFRDRRAFYAAFATTMRRILIDVARRQAACCNGGDVCVHPLSGDPPAASGPVLEVLLVHEALDHLEQVDPLAAELVKLHYFTGLSLPEVAGVLQLSRVKAYRVWGFARAWLKSQIEKSA